MTRRLGLPDARLIEIVSLMKSLDPHVKLPSSTTASVPALERGLDVLELLSREPAGLGISDLSAALALPKNAAFRIAHTLVARGYLLRDEATKRFRLSAKMLTVGQPRTGDVSLVEVALGPMRSLRDQTKETVQLGLRIGEEGVIIEQVAGLHPLRIAVDPGLRFPLHNNAPGKVLLAFQPEPERAALVARLPLVRSTNRTITSGAELIKECERVVAQGYGTDFGEADEGIHCVAAPVVGRHRALAAVLWVSAPARRMPKESFAAMGRQVMAAAAEVSRRIEA
jgi:DNA-binding IclR family transcriptional regulator